MNRNLSPDSATRRLVWSCLTIAAVASLCLLPSANAADESKPGEQSKAAASQEKDQEEQKAKATEETAPTEPQPPSSGTDSTASEQNDSSSESTQPKSVQPKSSNAERARRHSVLRPDSEDSRGQHQGESRQGQTEQANEEWEQSRSAAQRQSKARDRDTTQGRQYSRRQSSRQQNSADDDDQDSETQRRSQRQDLSRDDRSGRDRDRSEGLTERLKKTFGVFFSNDDDGRLTVSRTTPNGHAKRAGLEKGDHVFSVSGRRVSSEADFQRHMRSSRGGEVPIVVIRDGERQTIYWIVPEQGYSGSQHAGYSETYTDDTSDQYASGFSDEPQAFLGVQLDDRYPNAAVVLEVYEGSPADQAGLRRGDTITQLNGQPVRSSSDLTDQVSQMEPGEPVRMQISRRQTQTVQARLGKRDSSVGRASYQDDTRSRQSDRRYQQDEQDESFDSDSQDRSSDFDRDSSRERSRSRSGNESGSGRGRFFDRR